MEVTHLIAVVVNFHVTHDLHEYRSTTLSMTASLWLWRSLPFDDDAMMIPRAPPPRMEFFHPEGKERRRALDARI